MTATDLQPIETAPKDGSWIIGDDGRLYKWRRYKKNAPPEYVRLGGRWQVMEWNGDWHKWKNAFQAPTHWSPSKTKEQVTQ